MQQLGKQHVFLRLGTDIFDQDELIIEMSAIVGEMQAAFLRCGIDVFTEGHGCYLECMQSLKNYTLHVTLEELTLSRKTIHYNWNARKHWLGIM